MRIIFLSIFLTFPILAKTNERSHISRTWLRLLHYKNNKSRIDNSQFFLTKDGATNPLKELEKSLKVLKKNNSIDFKNFICKFPARTQYLKDEYDLHLPERSCREFETWKSSLQVEKLSLIYTSQFLNNPASAFGHTFLRLISKSRAINLNLTVNYAANVPNHISVLDYISKGLFGGFNGSFLITPFYIKIQEYQASEMRDLWEYPLTLTPSQKNLILAHIWELQHQAKLKYYFLDENCSQVLLDIILVALPQFKPRNSLLFITPLETIRYIYDARLTQQIKYHPSLFSKFIYRYKQLNHQQQMELQASLNNREKNVFSELDDIKLDYYEYQRLKNDGKIPNNLKSDYIKTLKLRAKKDITGSLNLPPKADPPHLSESSQRIKIGLYHQEMRGNKQGLELSYRLGLHDLMDTDNGYLKYSKLNFFKVNLLYENSKVSLNQFSLINLAKMSTINFLDSSPSWELSIGAISDQNMGCSRCIVQNNSVALG